MLTMAPGIRSLIKLLSVVLLYDSLILSTHGSDLKLGVYGQEPLPSGAGLHSETTKHSRVKRADEDLVGKRKAPEPPPAPTDMPYFSSVPIKVFHLDFFKKCFQILLDEGIFFNSEEEVAKPPLNFEDPDTLAKLFDFTLGQYGIDNENLLPLIKQIIRYSPKPSHPYMVSRRMAGLDPYGLMGEWLTTVLSTPVLTFFSAPIFTLAEFELQKKVRELVGYEGGGGDGVIAPGGGLANAYSIQLALQNSFPFIKSKGFVGIENPKAVMFISQAASDSLIKGAIFEGVGSDNCVKVKTDKFGRMDVYDLVYQIESAIRNESKPFMVVATAGTLTLGAIDPIDKISEICQHYSLWLHVDGQYSGSAILSNKERRRLNGIEKSDSFSWCPSWMLGIPFIGNVLVTKTAKTVYRTFNFQSTYVFGQNFLYNTSFDNGDSTIQTARRADVLKIWIAWKAKGQNQLEAHIDYVYENVRFCTSQLKSRKEKFQLMLDEFDSHLVSFYFVPSQLRILQRKQREILMKFSRFNEKLRNKLLKVGKMRISATTISNYPNPTCLTMNLGNSALTKDDITYLLDVIEFYGSELEKDFNWNNWVEKIQANPNIGKLFKKDAKGLDIVLMGNSEVIPNEKTRLPTPPPRPESYPEFVSAPIKSMHEAMYKQFFELVLDEGIFFQEKRREPALLFKTPEELLELFDFSLRNYSMKNEELFIVMEKIIKYSAHLAHPYFVAQLFTGLDPYSLIGDIILGTLTSPMSYYEDSPMFSLMEDELFRSLRRRINYSSDGVGDGLNLDGGSAANIIALGTAFHKKVSQTKKLGNSVLEKKLVMYSSQDAHYSFNKGSFFRGAGYENCIPIGTDERGKMSIPSLRRAIEKTKAEGHIPFMVAATAGTTSLGSIDPLEEVNKLCKEFDMWFHVDATFGGSISMAKNYSIRGLLSGVQDSDSFVVNFHKMFGATETATFLVSRHEDIFKDAFGVVKKDEDSEGQLYDYHKYDKADKYLGEDRRANAFKIWLLWKAKGIEGMGKHIEYAKENARYVSDQMATVRNETFKLLVQNPDLTNVCFYYKPASLNDVDPNSLEYAKKMSSVSLKIHAEIVRSGKMTLVPQEIRQMPIFLKFVLMSSGMTRADCDYLMDAIDYVGRDL